MPFSLHRASLVAGACGLLAIAAVVILVQDDQESAGPTRLEQQRDEVSKPSPQKSLTSPHVKRDKSGRLSWHRPRSSERETDRKGMVATQIARGGIYHKAVSDQRVLEAMRSVPRDWFVPRLRRDQAYDDTPLPIGHGQTISQPYIVALMTQHLQVKEGDKILEVGTGSGYQSAVLSELTPYVFTIEIVEPLHKLATRRYKEREYKTIQTRFGDGYDGWKEQAPFDGIIVTCSAGHVPVPLWEQLKPGGRMVIPVGGVYQTQRLLVLTKDADGKRKSKSVLPVRFVPMTGKMLKP